MRTPFLLLVAAGLAFPGCGHTGGSAAAPPATQPSRDAADLPAEAIRIEGTLAEGGVPERVEEVIDLRSGYRKTVQQRGSQPVFFGYDGQPWVAGNGIVNAIDVPALVTDARARAFADRAGCRLPTTTTEAPVIAGDPASGNVVRYRPVGGSDVDVTIDKTTRRVQQITIETDYGPVTTRYEDWRSVGSFQYPFRQVESDNTGETTILQAEHVTPLRMMEPNSLARPSAHPQVG